MLINKNDTINRLIHLAELSEKIYTVIMFGSQAREDHHADQYSDVDLIMIVDDPAYFINSDKWLNEIGKFNVSFIENTFNGEKERRVLFNNGLDADFIILPKTKVRELNGDILTLLNNGYRVLIDKIGLQYALPSIDTPKNLHALLTEQMFSNIVNDFWFHAVWTAKKIKRGELWSAKYCVDTYMKQKLLSMIEFHAHAIHGIEYNTWHNGRFIDEWAESWIINKLTQCFSHYNIDDIKKALLSTMDLFRSITVETSEKLNFQYPEKADKYTTGCVTNILL